MSNVKRTTCTLISVNFVSKLLFNLYSLASSNIHRNNMSDGTGTSTFGIQCRTEANFNQWNLRVLDNYARKCKEQHLHGLVDLVSTVAKWLGI